MDYHYHVISDEKDAEVFLSLINGLHDGYSRNKSGSKAVQKTLHRYHV